MNGPEVKGALGYADFRAILELKYRYCRLVDDQDWASLIELFTPDATLDVPVWRAPKPREAAISAYADHMDQIKSIHTVSMPVMVVETSDVVSVEWRMEDRLFSANAVVHGFGRYEDRCARVDGEWKISRLRLVRSRREERRVG